MDSINPKFILSIYLIFFFSIIVICTSCKKDDSEDEFTITNVSASDISESEFTASWSMPDAEIKQAIVEVSSNEDFSELVHDIILLIISERSIKVTNLYGASKYYFRIRIIFNDDSELISNTKSVFTTYTTESVMITTDDGIEVSGKLSYLDRMGSKRPGIIFMHEMGAWVNNWKASDVLVELVSKGYVCLVIDFRGHGQSSDWELPTTIGGVEAFINVIEMDLIASIDYLESQAIVDSGRIALMGGSLGAIMALAGNGFECVKASVSLSASRMGVNSIFPSHQITSALFIAAELDENAFNTNFATEATKMYEQAAEPKKLIILEGKTDHGTNLLSPTINQEIVEWIEARFGS